MSYALPNNATNIKINNTIANNINEKISLEKYKHSNWIILAKDLTTNKIIYQHNQNSMINPASVTKLFSVSAALHYLGYDYRFETPVYFFGKKDGATLKGDLILVGQGDLTLGFRYKGNEISYNNMDHIYANAFPIPELVKSNPLLGLNELAKQIAKAGVKEIKGNILIDNRLFDTTHIRDYNLSPTMVNEGFIDLVIKPTQAGSSANITMVPENKFYKLNNEVKTIAKGETDITPHLDSMTKVITLKGSIIQGDKQVLRNVNVQNQAKFARFEFIKALERQGIKVDIVKDDRTLPTQDKYKDLQPLAKLISPPFSEYAKLIFKTSHNPGADLIPLLIAAHFNKKTYEDGISYIAKFLKENVKLDPNAFVFVQASGGTSLNKVTPKAVIKLLTYIHHQPNKEFEAFKNALPILGVNGSLFLSGKNSPAKGHLFAKTGTEISYDVANKRLWYYSEALGGYVITKNNHIIAFVVNLQNLPMKSINDMFAVQNAVSAVGSEFYQP